MELCRGYYGYDIQPSPCTERLKPAPVRSLKRCAVFGGRPALTAVVAGVGAHSYNVCRNFMSESGGPNRRNVVSGASSRASAFPHDLGRKRSVRMARFFRKNKYDKYHSL